MTPPLPLGERATRDVPVIGPPPGGAEGGRTQPATTHDIDDALTGEIESNLWNAFGKFPMTRGTELAAQAAVAAAVLLAPAAATAAWFAARLALHLIAERHEARAWRERAAGHEDAATGSEYGGL